MHVNTHHPFYVIMNCLLSPPAFQGSECNSDVHLHLVLPLPKLPVLIRKGT